MKAFREAAETTSFALKQWKSDEMLIRNRQGKENICPWTILSPEI